MPYIIAPQEFYVCRIGGIHIKTERLFNAEIRVSENGILSRNKLGRETFHIFIRSLRMLLFMNIMFFLFYSCFFYGPKYLFFITSKWLEYGNNGRFNRDNDVDYCAY